MLRLLIVSVLALGLASCSPAPAATPAATDTPEPTATPTLMPTPEPTASPAPTPSAIAAETQDWLPGQRSVWDTQVSPGEALGRCDGSVPLPVYGLVQITPLEDGLEWRNQEPQPYRMKRVAPRYLPFRRPERHQRRCGDDDRDFFSGEIAGHGAGIHAECGAGLHLSPRIYRRVQVVSLTSHASVSPPVASSGRSAARTVTSGAAHSYVCSPYEHHTLRCCAPALQDQHGVAE